jgi:hypothetical protein
MWYTLWEKPSTSEKKDVSLFAPKPLFAKSKIFHIQGLNRRLICHLILILSPPQQISIRAQRLSFGLLLLH